MSYPWIIFSAVFLDALVVYSVNYLHPGEDKAVLIAIAVATLVPTVGALLAMMISSDNKRAIHGVHLALNSRMDDLLVATEAKARSEERGIAADTAAALDVESRLQMERLQAQIPTLPPLAGEQKETH